MTFIIQTKIQPEKTVLERIRNVKFMSPAFSRATVQDWNREMQTSWAACALQVFQLPGYKYQAQGQVPWPLHTSIFSDIERVITRAPPWESECHMKYMKHLALCLVHSNHSISDSCYYAGTMWAEKTFLACHEKGTSIHKFEYFPCDIPHSLGWVLGLKVQNGHQSGLTI